MVREFFLNYNEALSNDFVLSEGGRRIEFMSTDISEWRITFVDTGMHANLGQRLLAARKYLRDEKEFLANYSDGLSDVPIDRMVEDFRRKDFTASFVAIRPSGSFHVVQASDDGVVKAIGPMQGSPMLINGGFFVLKQEIFDHVRPGEELVEQPFQRLAQAGKLGTWRHDGFWKAMDTLKDKIDFDRMDARNECPWMVWNR
jgi:glucose-1-phosphate cytidylyltransferase